MPEERPAPADRPLLGVLAVLGSWAALLFPLLVLGQVPAARDHRAYYWPVKTLVEPLTRLSGGIPLWNPFLAAGQPFAANPEHAVFHPLTALFLLVPFELAYRLQVALPLLAAGLGAFFLGRALRLEVPGAALLAVSWGVGGYMVSSVALLPILVAVAALPLAMGFAARLGGGGTSRDTAGLAVSQGLLVLSGEPSTILLSALLVPVAAWHGWALGPRAAAPAARRAAVRVGAGFVLGIGVGAAMLLPGLDHARKTVRAEGLAAASASRWSSPPPRLAEAFVPGVSAVESAEPEALLWRRTLYPDRLDPFLFSVYPGLLVSALAVVAWTRRGSSERVWLLVGIVGIALALGRHLPFWGLVRLVPPLDGLRYPEKLLLLPVVALTVSGACGLTTLLASPGSGRARLGLALLAFAGAAGAFRLCGGAALLAPMPAAVAEMLLSRQAVVALASGAALLLSRRSGAIALLPAAVVAVDLVLAGRPLLFLVTPVTLRSAPPAFAPLLARSPEGYLVHLADHDAVRGGLEGLGAPPVPAQFRIPTALEPDFDLTELVWSARATRRVLAAATASPQATVAIMQRRSVAALVHFAPGAPTGRAEARSFPLSRLLALSQVPAPKPFAFCADALERVEGPEGWTAAMTRLGAAAAGTACVDVGDAGGLPQAVSPGEVHVRERRPGHLVLEVEARGPRQALVCVNQTWDAGWRATIDGGPAPVSRVDLSLCAVPVPPGRHRVELTYRNRWVTAGIAVSLASLLAAALLFRRGAPR